MTTAPADLPPGVWASDEEIQLWKKFQKEVTRDPAPEDQHERIQAVIDQLFALEAREKEAAAKKDADAPAEAPKTE